MSLVEQKLIDAYAVLVMAKRYILKESDRIHENQKLVPSRYMNDIEIKVAEKTAEALEVKQCNIPID